MKPFRIPIILASLLFLSQMPLPAWAGTNPAEIFVRALKAREYAKAYEQLSPDLKSRFSLGQFENEQKEAETQFAGEFGTSEILRAEQIFLEEKPQQKNVVEQMQLGDVDLGKLMFWNWWKPGGPKRLFYQFVFGEGKKVVFGVDIKEGVVTNYEFLPRLQAVLSSEKAEITVKKTRVLA